MTPYVRCKLSGEIINVKSNDTHVDHIDGDRTNNNPKNFSLVKSRYNHMKSDSKSYAELYEVLKKSIKELEKHKNYW